MQSFQNLQLTTALNADSLWDSTAMPGWVLLLDATVYESITIAYLTHPGAQTVLTQLKILFMLDFSSLPHKDNLNPGPLNWSLQTPQYIVSLLL